MTETDNLIHFGTKGMKWGVRKTSTPLAVKKAPMTRKEKQLLGATIVSTTLLAAGGVTIAALAVRNTQYKISTAQGRAWVENMIRGVEQYQTVSPEGYRNAWPKKETFGLVKQIARNRDMLNYIKS